MTRILAVTNQKGGVGKTTTLQILSSYIDSNERIIVIEDTSELRPVQEHVVNLETRAADEHGRGGVTLKDLTRNSLRMRPDRLIFGEARITKVYVPAPTFGIVKG